MTIPPAYSPIFNSTFTYSPGSIVWSGLGTSALTRTVEVVGSMVLSMNVILPVWGWAFWPPILSLTSSPFLTSLVMIGR